MVTNNLKGEHVINLINLKEKMQSMPPKDKIYK